MDPKPRYGRTETQIHLFPIVEVSMPEAGPKPGVTYGLAVNGMKYHDPIELDFTVPHLILTLRLADAAVTADPLEGRRGPAVARGLGAGRTPPAGRYAWLIPTDGE